MKIDRALGCLLGQLAGDALGRRLEFQSPMRFGAAILMVSERWRMAVHGRALPTSQPMIPKWLYSLPRCW